MHSTKIIAGILLLAVGTGIQAQEKRAMTFDDMTGWQHITQQSISNNGRWVSCKMEPWRGDPTVYLYNHKGEKVKTFPQASDSRFSFSSEFLLVTRTPSLKTIEDLKLKKKSKDKMPMNHLTIYQLSGRENSIDSIRNYKLAESANLLAYQRGGKKDSTLYVVHLGATDTIRFAKVTDYGFASKSAILYYVSDSLLYTYSEKDGSHLLSDKKGTYPQIAFSEKGNKLAYLLNMVKDSSSTCSILYLSEENQPGKQIADRKNAAFPKDWVISENRLLHFSKDDSHLYFGTAPRPLQKDTTILAENFPGVQVWHWQEKVQYTQQAYNKKNDLKRSYTAVYNLVSQTVAQLTDKEVPGLQVADESNGPVALAYTTLPYDTESMWTGRKRYDVYTINLENGEKELLKRDFHSYLRLSPKGHYAYWYCDQDSSWYTLDMVDKKEYRLTSPTTFPAWDEENDVPDYPAAYGCAGWTDNDRYILLQDRYDIFRFDPKMKEAKVNLTKDGRNLQRNYSLIRLDPDKRSIDLKELNYLSAFDEKTKGTGYYSIRFDKAAAPKTLIAGDFYLSRLKKAKNSDAVIYTQETYTQYPDVRLSDLSFKNSKQLTNGGKQQEHIIWGTTELISWMSLDGQQLEGVIYKPENFDPKKKYPMIVNFYERNSETLNKYHMCSPGRSTIDYPFYLSHGYIIFNPDVHFTDGHPGESCYNCVMPGIAEVVSRGYVNEKAIGAQGHSWGGFQVAYLATKTRLFAAIESGAPVVNMLSAYGGIRWGSGLNRSMQYEHGQSRIGGNIWEKPLQYLENSPLLNMDKVTTPILIMHNDADGHVPWYQGIEYFVALKRLQKPVWLLNYTGEPHWPMRMANRIDFQKRMFQFFEHYLKQAPMPQWMSEGVPAVDQDFKLGYDKE